MYVVFFFSFSCLLIKVCLFNKVYRVSWLRARAQKNRWQEELPLTKKEMVWTILFFMHQRDIWYSQLQDLQKMESFSLEHKAYCEQMISQWEEFARIADFQFTEANPDFLPTWCPMVTPV